MHIVALPGHPVTIKDLPSIIVMCDTPM